MRSNAGARRFKRAETCAGGENPRSRRRCGERVALRDARRRAVAGSCTGTRASGPRGRGRGDAAALRVQVRARAVAAGAALVTICRDCRCSSSACALLLIDRGAACDARDEDGLVAMCWAWWVCCHVAFPRLILRCSKNALTLVIESMWRKHGIAALPNDGDEALAIQSACNSSKPGAAVTTLLTMLFGEENRDRPSMKTSLDTIDEETRLPAVFTACLRGSSLAVEQFCQVGASVRFRDSTGRNIYHYLATHVRKLHPHTILVVAAASCDHPMRYKTGTKCIVVRARDGNEMFVPKGLNFAL